MWRNVERRSGGVGTYITCTMPWSLYTRNGHRAICADGVVRAVEMASTPDTFFSIPARCRIDGRWVSGYVTTHGNAISRELDGFHGPDLPPETYEFRHHTCHASHVVNLRNVW